MSLIKTTRLSSGIGVITEEMPDVESCSIGIWVKTGSRNENIKVNGISHFIEHLLFKGTKKRSALDISRTIESVGGVLNAFTGREYTCFYAKVLNNDLQLAVDLLSDMFLHSKFDSKEMEKEKMVVLQEIKMVEDTPDDLVHDLFAERFWADDPLGRPILGTAASLKGMSRNDILDYYGEHYMRSSSVLITAAGGLKHGKVLKTISAAFSRLKKTAAFTIPPAPPAVPGAKLYMKDSEQTHLCIGVPVAAQSHPDRYKLYLLNTILGGGMSSRLFQEIREKRGLAYSVYSYLSLCMDAGSFITYAGTSAESFKKVIEIILKEYDKAGKDITASELKNAKEQLKGGMLLGLETSDSRMSKLARDEMNFGRCIPVKEIVGGIDSVTLAETRRSARDYLAPEKITLVSIGKMKEGQLPGFLRKNLS